MKNGRHGLYNLVRHVQQSSFMQALQTPIARSHLAILRYCYDNWNLDPNTGERLPKTVVHWAPGGHFAQFIKIKAHLKTGERGLTDLGRLANEKADLWAGKASEDTIRIQIRGQHGWTGSVANSQCIPFSDEVMLFHGPLQINTKIAPYCQSITDQENIKYMASLERPVMGLTARLFRSIHPATHDLLAIDQSDISALRTDTIQLRDSKAKAFRSHLRIQSFAHMLYAGW
jgi:hypothetical protein